MASTTTISNCPTYTGKSKPAEARQNNDGRSNNFDFLRLSLAILVIFSHSFALGLGSELSEPFRIFSHGQTTGGAIAVNCFFIMSGYLIAASFLRSSNWRSYLGKRIRRIYPGFIAAMLLCMFVIVPISGGALTGSAPFGKLLNFIGHTLWLRESTYSGVFQLNRYPNAINGSVWSIPFEFWCYIGVMILGLRGLLTRRKLMLSLFAVSVLVSIAFQVFQLKISGSILGLVFGYPPFWARLIPLFLAGTLFYLYKDKIRYNNRGALLCAAVLVASCFVPFAFGAVFPFVGGYLVFWFAFNKSIRLYNVGKLGDFSYGTYLYAFPLQQLIVHAFGGAVNPFVLFLLATPLTLAFAIGSWFAIEEPLMKFNFGRALATLQAQMRPKSGLLGRYHSARPGVTGERRKVDNCRPFFIGLALT
jgi:peptidoglycan/LPS O-acetylase OafA/YrhL